MEEIGGVCGSGRNDNGERLQGLWQSSNECGSGSQSGGGVLTADGIRLGVSKKFEKPPLKGLSRTIDCQGNNGVVEWKK